ncbi:hypothetical protein YC2023_105195 [Brassica napus]
MRGYQIQTRRSFQNLLTSKNSHKRQEHMLRKTSFTFSTMSNLSSSYSDEEIKPKSWRINSGALSAAMSPKDKLGREWDLTI